MEWSTDLEHILRRSESLASWCWLGIGGPAEYFAEPTTLDELKLLIDRCLDADLPVHILGGGSNVLIRDAGLPGVLVSLANPAFTRIETEGTILRAGGGALLSHAILAGAREGLAGLESLVGVPGTVGGALHGNAGDRTDDVGRWFQQATVLTRSGEILTRTKDEARFGYRESSLDELVIVEAEFSLEEDDREQLTRRMQNQWIVKRSAQPTRERRTACLFKDALGMTAGEVIEQAGLRDLAVGGAALFDADPKFVVVNESASSDDVLRLMDTIRSQVEQQLGVELQGMLDIW